MYYCEISQFDVPVDFWNEDNDMLSWNTHYLIRCFGEPWWWRNLFYHWTTNHSNRHAKMISNIIIFKNQDKKNIFLQSNSLLRKSVSFINFTQADIDACPHHAEYKVKKPGDFYELNRWCLDNINNKWAVSPSPAEHSVSAPAFILTNNIITWCFEDKSDAYKFKLIAIGEKC